MFNFKRLLTDASNNPLVCDGGNKVRVSFGASIFLRLQHVVGILKDRIVTKADHLKLLQKQKNLVSKIRYRVTFYNELYNFLFKAISSLQESLALIPINHTNLEGSRWLIRDIFNCQL